MKTKVRLLVIIFIVLLLCAPLFISHIVKLSAKPSIKAIEEVSKLENIDCVIVLGCQVRADGTLSHMLRDRLIRGIEIYNTGSAPKLLMSGDHGRKEYNEVGAMKQYAIDNGVPSEDVFMDHAGFSTYETMYRAKEIFQVKRAIIVTQEYHLYRAVYIAKQLGIEAYGVSADLNRYAGQSTRDVREVLARCKDFVMGILKPEPTYLGDIILIGGNGDLTND